MKTEKISNYQKLCGEWAEKFLLMDKEELMKRLPELKREKDYMTIWHFGVKFGVSEKDGSIICMSEEREPEVTEMLNIYTLLGYVKSDAFFMNKWVPFADLRGARPFGPAYKIGVTDVFAATFSDHEEELREAFEKHRSVMMQMPTGTGKTVVLASLVRQFVDSDGSVSMSGAENERGCSVLVVAHRIELVEQTGAFLRRFGIDHGVIAGGQWPAEQNPPWFGD